MSRLQNALIFIMLTTLYIVVMLGIVLPIVLNLMDFQPNIDLSSNKYEITNPIQSITTEIVKERLVTLNQTACVEIQSQNGSKRYIYC